MRFSLEEPKLGVRQPVSIGKQLRSVSNESEHRRDGLKRSEVENFL